MQAFWAHVEITKARYDAHASVSVVFIRACAFLSSKISQILRYGPLMDKTVIHGLQHLLCRAFLCGEREA